MFARLILLGLATYMMGMTFSKNATTMSGPAKNAIRVLTFLSLMMLLTG